MIKVKEIDVIVRGRKFRAGDLFTDNAGEFYILSEIPVDGNYEMKFVAVNITTGGYWAPPSNSTSVATQDLLIVRRGSKIELEVY